jgi:tellurite resistance protein
MPPRFTRFRHRIPIVTLRPAPDTVQGIVLAAAMVACVDGHAASIERGSLIRFLRYHGVLARRGRAEPLAAFDQAVRHAAPMTLEQSCAEADRLRPLAGRVGAPMIAQAAAQVALADGRHCPREMTLLAVIRDRLGLPTWNPAPVWPST